MAKKPSFFDRLTGASFESDFDSFDDDAPLPRDTSDDLHTIPPEPEEPGAAQLTVDVLQDDSEIIIRSLVAGVRPEDLDIAITRDMVTIQGKRVDQKDAEDDEYVYRELYWGAFARTIVLPAEVDVDNAEASEKHGLLTIKLPKINKDRQTKLKVKG
ncbi:Hsp20/alpha crystallin family protein [Patescibacteria group bacterium]|nr:MAG: Hsp20/alpha crystallin family protein [Patescibacteria group bacterium]